ncbi:hypothetical protein, partial [Microvirga aerophila]|uniref:hypothetical protein n=1 Tax=Microvirga aerophila TaxID=670291 RepID=UPI001AED4988
RPFIQFFRMLFDGCFNAHCYLPLVGQIVISRTARPFNTTMIISNSIGDVGPSILADASLN